MNSKPALHVASLILTVGAAHAETTRLTAVEDSYPWPSPDGKSIVFESNRTGIDQIYTVGVDGSSVRRLTDYPGGAETPVYSPDGEWIAFAAFVDGDDGGNDVFVMRADGSDKRRLTNGPGYDGHPHWSADGKRIVFNSDRTSPDLEADWWDRWHEIFSMKRDGSDVRQHTHCKTVCTFGSLSPDGSRIAYRKVTDDPGFDWLLRLVDWNSEVVVADIDGGNEVNVTNNAAYDGWPRWSPDGSSLVIASNRLGPSRVAHLYVITPDGSSSRRITSGPWSYTQPAWSTDGSRIYAYQAEERYGFETGGVVAIDLEP